MHLWLRALILLILLTPPFAGVSAQTNNEFSEIEVDYHYGIQATFHARIQPVDGSKDAFLYLQADGDATRAEKVDINAAGEILYFYNLINKPLRPFSRVDYWFRVTTTSGVSFQSEKHSFNYVDNRLVWQNLEDKFSQVHWNLGDLAFGQSVLTAVLNGLRSATTILPVAPPLPIKFFVYAKASDLQSALLTSQKSWIAGHTSPDIGTILLSIPPGSEQQLEMDRQIPHELMHILTYQLTGESYQRLPIWLVEGLASLAELNPNPDYSRALSRAVADRNLIAFSQICTAFPADASGAFVAYAQSASFVRFLKLKFGSNGLQNLITTYKNGLGCEEAVQAAMGFSLAQLELLWQQETLNINPEQSVLQALSPYLLIAGLLILVPLAIGLFSTRSLRSRSSFPKAS